MTITRKQKVEQLEALTGEFAKAQSLVLADFSGMKPLQVDQLRRKCEEAQVTYVVVKNTLAALALKGTKNEAGGKAFKGNTAVAYSYDDPASPARVLLDFAKTLDKLKVKAAIFDGQVLDAEGVVSLSKLPSKNEARAMLLSVFNAPASQMVRVLAAGPQNILNVLQARKTELEKQAA